MRTKWHLVGILLTIVGSVASARAQEAPATTRSATAEAKIISARVTRANAEVLRQFRNRYYSDSNAGVSIQLLLTLKGATVLPLAQDAVALDTFVDDTYASLLGATREGISYPMQPPVVSDDGQQLLFTIASSRAPADNAGRVFVRGTINARVGVGEPKTARADLLLSVGQQAVAGPFEIALKSISEQTPGKMSISISVDGDVARLRKIRVLSTDGKPISDDAENRLPDLRNSAARGGMPASLVFAAGHKQCTVEFVYSETVESVRIPFEAQVDIGVVKAGPLQRGDQEKEKASTKDRPWPPPPADARTELPARRPMLAPPTQPSNEPLKLEKVGVDLFFLGVGKPAPGEAAGVKWTNPPARTFHASGFTIARLMLTTPGIEILSIVPGGVSINRFEDDKGGKLPVNIMNASDPRGAPYVQPSPDGQQALLTLSLPVGLTPGATRCTLAGSIKANVARGTTATDSEAVPLQKGQTFSAGQVTGRIMDIRQQPTMQPGYIPPTPIGEIWVEVQGNTGTIRSIDLIDPATKDVMASNRYDIPSTQGRTSAVFSLSSLRRDTEKVIVRVRHYPKPEVLDVPFEVATSIGL